MKKTDDQKAATLARRAAHFAALEALTLPDAKGRKPSGLSTWLKLRRIETRAHNAATAQCNGEAYQGEPFRAEEEHDAFLDGIRADVGRTLGGVPAGFFVNGDPRGYALKIRTARSNDGTKDVAEALPPGLCTDWGGYGILATEID